MIICHEIPWKDCLSHQIWPQIKKGWKDEGRPVHFFWGLAGRNVKEIQEVMDKKEEWYFVDTGYLTEQIVRYPLPKIMDYDRTYFRICKGFMHSKLQEGFTDGSRLQKLESQGIDVEFRGWNTGETKHILLAPSSPMVTLHINNMTQEEWTERMTKFIRRFTDREIRFRNKPRPNNEWWNTDIRDDLKECHALVTNMSLSAIVAVQNMVPVFTHHSNVCDFISGRIDDIEQPRKPGRKVMNNFFKMIADQQFTLDEMGSGVAYEILKKQR